MADRYWVGGSGTWNNVSTTNWSATSGGPGGASPPVAGDDVFFNSASNGTSYTVTMAASTTYNYRNISISGPATGTVSFSGGTTATHNHGGSVTVASTGVGSLYAALWITNNFTATAAGQTINLNGNSMGSMIFNGVGGAWTLTSNGQNSANTMTLTAGTLNFGSVTWTMNGFSSSGSLVRALNLGSATLNIGNDFNISSASTNLTVNGGTSTINLTGTTSPGFFGASFTYNNVNWTSTSTGGISMSYSGNNTIANLSVAAPSGTTLNTMSVSGNLVITGTLTMTSSAPMRRLFVNSSTVGTTYTWTVAAASLSNVDFRDIAFAGVAAPVSGTSLGDCGGNSGITFPAPKTVYWVLAGSSQWGASAGLAWALSSGGSPSSANFPLAQDTVIIDNAVSITSITFDYSWAVGTFSAQARTNAWTLSFASAAPSVYSNWTSGTGVTTSGTLSVVWIGRTSQIIDSSGRSWSNGWSIAGLGTYTLASEVTMTGTLFHIRGTFNTANYNITCAIYSSTTTNTRTAQLGTSTINLSSVGTVWNLATSTNLTLNAANATINLTNTTTTSRTMELGSTVQTYGTINIGGTTGSSTTLIIGATSVNTVIRTLSSTKTVAHTISFQDNFTINNWSVTGSSGAVVSVNSDVTGSIRTLTYTGSQINLAFMSFRDVNFSYTLGQANPYLIYATNSTNLGNVGGIAFIDGLYQKAYRLTSGTSWTVPSDWTNTNNIYMIGAGGGGASAAVSGNNRAAGGGGGGGGYRVITNFSASPGATVNYTIGAAAVANADGGDTTWNSGAFTAGGGKRGTAATTPSSAGGAGGTGDFAGGTGGAGAFGTTASQGYGAGGGGGAGGPNGPGGNGGNGFASTVIANIAGGGGGGNGGGGNGGNASAATGGLGGNNFGGAGGGATNGAAGTRGGGGAGNASGGSGGSGGSGVDIQNTLGGAGGRGGAASASSASNSGIYGGGGGGGGAGTNGSAFSGGASSGGVIFIVYNLPPRLIVESGWTIGGAWSLT